MRRNTIFNFILLIFTAIIIFSCSEYDKILKSSDYDLKYRKALQYYNKKDYARASSLFEQIVNVYRATAKGDSVMYFYAKSYYGSEDYIMAGHYFKEFSENYGRSPFVEEADYLVGYCLYLMSPRPSLDQENTKLSIQAFQKFLYKHPESKYIPECKRLIVEMNDKLAEKDYLNASQYYNMGSVDTRYYKSALISLRNCLTEFPDNKYREDLMFMILQSNYMIAENSVPLKRKERFQATLDDYYTFVAEFPSGKYTKSATKIYDNTKQVLGL
jgi:outer membrane protein assembly factor BamD